MKLIFLVFSILSFKAQAGITPASGVTQPQLDDVVTAIEADLAMRLRVDTAAQGLSGAQKTNAKTNIDLNLVDNVADASKPVSTLQAAAIATSLASANVYTDTGDRLTSVNGDFSFVEDGTFTLELSSDRAKTLSTLVVQLDTGTCTVSIQKNGVNVTGMASLSVTTSLQTFTAVALNSIAVNDKITLIITSTVNASGLAFSLKAL